jgi:Nuclease A inhibitor-like protein
MDARVLSMLGMSLIEKLKAARAGLLMPSESNYPFGTVFRAGAAANFDGASLRDVVQRDASTPISITALDDFFRNVAVPQPWHDVAQSATLLRFAAFMIGKAGNDIASLVTTLIETSVAVRTAEA